MQLMTFNSLLMFDIVFMFFLFLVGVTCLVYYLPTGRPHRSLVQTTESLIESERCRYRQRNFHLLSQKSGNGNRILKDEPSSEYEEDEDDINDHESDEFEEIHKSQSKKRHSRILEKQHNCNLHMNENNGSCTDIRDINLTEKNEIKLMKLRNNSYYPTLRQKDRPTQNKDNSNKNKKILYHCCPPCNLSDCEHFYVSYEIPGNKINKNNDIFSNSTETNCNNKTDTVHITVDKSVDSSHYMYLNDILQLEEKENDKNGGGGGNNDNVGSNLIGIGNIHKNRTSNYIDCEKIPPLLKLKSKAIINNKQTGKTLLAKNISEAELTNKNQPIVSLSSSILSMIDEKNNITQDFSHDDNYNDDDDDDGDDDDDNFEYIDEDDDCYSATSVDIVLAEGIDDDASKVIIYDNKRKCQHNFRNRYINTDRESVRKTSTNNNKNYNKNNESQPISLNINTATVAASLREHFYLIKETEKVKEGISYCNNCNTLNYSPSSSSLSSSCINSNLKSLSSPLSSVRQDLQSCNNIPCPLLSSSSQYCSAYNVSQLLNTSTLLKSSSFIPSPTDSPILSSHLSYISPPPPAGIRFSSPSSTAPALDHQPYCCHVKAKTNELKDCMGPIVDV